MPTGRLKLETVITPRPGKGVEKLDLSYAGSTLIP